jgi:hypothetical protein
MNLHSRVYHYVGKITLKNRYTLKLERLPDEDIDPWLFLVFDKKGERRCTFFYKIEHHLESFYEKSFNILMSFIMEGMENVIELYQTYDVWRGEEFIGNIKINEALI